MQKQAYPVSFPGDFFVSSTAIAGKPQYTIAARQPLVIILEPLVVRLGAEHMPEVREMRDERHKPSRVKSVSCQIASRTFIATSPRV